MFRRYLLKKKFWPVKSRNGETVFMTHSAANGGIYAYLEQGERRGVKIVAGGKESFFDNFDNLDEFLDGLQRQEKTQASFMNILARRTRETYFRQLAI